MLGRTRYRFCRLGAMVVGAVCVGSAWGAACGSRDVSLGALEAERGRDAVLGDTGGGGGGGHTGGSAPAADACGGCGEEAPRCCQACARCAAAGMSCEQVCGPAGEDAAAGEPDAPQQRNDDAGTNDPGPPQDAGAPGQPPTDTPDPPEEPMTDGDPCGPVRCGTGMLCCDPDCGWCVAPDERCDPFACAPSRDPGISSAATPDAQQRINNACSLAECGPLPASPDTRCRQGGDGGSGLICQANQDGTCQWQRRRCISAEERPCSGSDSECEADQYCALPGAGLCDQVLAGVCRLKPGRCGEVNSPVCGCDGETYANKCLAARAGAAIGHSGPCP